MAFRDFTYPAVVRDLGLTERTADLFADVPPIPSPDLARRLRGGVRLATTIHTEKARSEWMIAPVLGDLWDRSGERFNLHSGVEFDADPEAGLVGVVDFLIGRTPPLPHVAAPVAVLFEAKRDSIPSGYAQCIAAMAGVQRYNRREGTEADPVWGCSTTGTAWRFLTLSGAEVTVDRAEYTIAEVDKLVGILAHIVGVPLVAPPDP